MDEVKLLPCPFCGDDEELRVCQPAHMHGYWVVHCGCCAGEMQAESEGGAVAGWNTRPPIGTDEVVERVLEPVRKVRDGYVSQMKFCDIEAMGYFREFVRRLDEAFAAMPAIPPQGLGAIPGSHPADQAPSGLGASRFDPERIGRWFSVAEDGPPMPEVFVLCWDGQTTFVEWCGSKTDFGRGVTHWIPYETPPGASSDMHDGRRAFASVDTLPKGQDAQQGLAGTEGSAVAATSGETPTPGPAIDQDGGEG